MQIGRSLGVLLTLLIGSSRALAQEVTVSGRLLAQASPLVRNHYVQTYTIDSRPDHPLKSVQLASTDFDAVLIAVAPDGTAYDDDDSAGGQNARLEMAPRTGEWLIVVTADEMRRAGSYSLTVDGPSPLPTNRRLPRAAIERVSGERRNSLLAQPRVDTVTVTKVDTVTVTRVDTVFKMKVDTVTRSAPAPGARGTTPR